MKKIGIVAQYLQSRNDIREVIARLGSAYEVFRGEVDRKSLADNGKALFEAAFTLAGQQPHLRALLGPVRR